MTRIEFESDVTTDPEHGKRPHDRTVEELLASGWFLIDKPPGPSSHQIAAWVRDMLKVDKISHGGTLDPFATGALTILTGGTTRLTDRILLGKKTYVAVLRIPAEVEEVALEEAVSNLTGRIHNVPPKESAVKVRVRQRTIDEFTILDRDGRIVLARISCEAGTYVRTIAKDMGLLLDGPVELVELRRSTSGIMDEEDAVTLQQLSDAIYLWREHGDDTAMAKILQPIESLLTGMPSLTVKDGAVAALTHGAPLAKPGLVEMSSDLATGDEVAINSLKGEVVCIASMITDSESIQKMNKGEVARPKVVLMGNETYPKRW